MPDDIQETKYRFDPILSAHPSFCQTDYVNDQSWQVCLDRNFVSGIALETSYGLQTRITQVFPVFLDATNLPIKEPHPIFNLQFVSSEQIRYRILLFPDMDVFLTLRVPNSHTLTGEVEFHNHTMQERKIHVGVLVRFAPHESGHDLKPQTIHEHTILSCQTEGLAPVLMVTGMPTIIHQPHPGLSLKMLVAKSHPAKFRWVLATETNVTESIDQAENCLKQNWQAQFKKSEIRLAGTLIHIHSDMPEMDEVLMHSQIEMQRLWMSKTDKTPFATVVTNRQPDQGYSARTDGSDYSPGWHGPSAWEMYYSVRNLLLPGNAELAAGMFHNFIQLSQGFGEVDLRPGLGGQRTHLLAPPILATSALEIYAHTGNKHRLAEAYPVLNYFLKKWQDPENDRDQDHLPEWRHPLQTGWEENPLWDAWQPGGKGYSCDTVESPALGALIFREMISLEKIARIIEKPGDADSFSEQAREIRDEVNRMWDKRKKIFRYRDRETHTTPTGKNITRAKGAGSFPIDRVFDTPSRLSLTVIAQKDITRPIQIEFNGLDQTGQHIVETFPQNHIFWSDNRSTLTSRLVYSRLEFIEITGLTPSDEWQVNELDLSQFDLTLLLPLWAGIPSANDAEKLVRTNLIPAWLEGFDHGLAMLPGLKPDNPLASMQIQWTTMIIDGLLDYGFQAEANQLVNQVMEAIINLTRSSGSFYERYHLSQAKGSGQRNHLLGLAPVSQYLRNQGIVIRSAGEIEIMARPELDNELDVRFQGTKIKRNDRQTVIRFADDNEIVIAADESKIIQWKTAGGG